MTGASFDMFQIHNLSETHLHCSNKTCLGILPCFKDNYDGCFVNKPNLLAEAAHQGRRHGGAWGGVAPSLGLSRPLTRDECENRFYLWNIMVYLKNTVAKWIGFLALIWCYYSKHLGQSVSQSRILITSDTQTSRASGSTKCRHYAALLTKLKVWWNIFLMFNRGLNYRS